MELNNIKILYVLNAVTLCSVFVLFFLYVHAPKQSLGNINAVAQSGNPLPNAQPVSNVVVGNNNDTPAARIQGPVTQVSGGTLTVKDQATGQMYTVSTNANTEVVLVSALKDPAAYQKEMDAYYAQIKLLMQDPAKNKDALASLTIPNPAVLRPDTLANVTTGNFVEAVAANPITGKSFTAIKIIRTPQQ